MTTVPEVAPARHCLFSFYVFSFPLRRRLRRMGSPNISSSKKSKCSLTNKHVRIIRNLAEKKKNSWWAVLKQTVVQNHTWQLWHFGCRGLLDQLCLHINILQSQQSSAKVWLFPSPVFAEQFPQATQLLAPLAESVSQILIFPFVCPCSRTWEKSQ